MHEQMTILHFLINLIEWRLASQSEREPCAGFFNGKSLDGPYGMQGLDGKGV